MKTSTKPSFIFLCARSSKIDTIQDQEAFAFNLSLFIIFYKDILGGEALVNNDGFEKVWSTVKDRYLKDGRPVCFLYLFLTSVIFTLNVCFFSCFFSFGWLCHVVISVNKSEEEDLADTLQLFENTHLKCIKTLAVF